MADTEFVEQLRKELPRLLREHPEVRHELWGMMLEVFPSRQEFTALLEEIRALREDTNRRFEEMRQDMDQRFEAMDRRFEEMRQDMDQRFKAVDRRFEAIDRRFEAMDQRFEAIDRRFEAVDRRFEAVIEELRRHGEILQQQGRQLREFNLHLSSLGGRVGYGLEHVVREVVEEFAGQTFPFAEHLVLQDAAGEVFGVVGAEVEFDLYVHDGGAAYLVEVKSHLKTSDVLMFHRKVRFAERRLGRQVTPLIIALSMEPRAEQKMKEIGVQYRVRAVVADAVA